ncbi:hypothetical protein [Pseudobacteriovorax antillogorgiicola]|uniref:Lipoprotein n=1 Tax=Pseudobacteriovorax antillogorgiicola TaxID=1513793 RepID=A0A1Y6BX40_9BACT|nr:hypothetical protein [Pseudobacteriovorax antillogorgiicola]TCS53752.1 hypothetical protein EDD56_10761 [Pseudobacteriovorax antillogorgiicola]SMF22581.1 hypothetical protein SAMN06296036_107211 [Pseudobacteriovorax antillogorgiicola]
MMKFAFGTLMGIWLGACTSVPERIEYTYDGAEDLSESALDRKLVNDLQACDRQASWKSTDDKEQPHFFDDRYHENCMNSRYWQAEYHD